jgi:hypothetical protein
MACGVLGVELHYKGITFGQIGMTEGRNVPQAVSRRPIIADARVQCQTSPYRIHDSQSGTGTGSSPSTPCFVRAYSSITFAA